MDPRVALECVGHYSEEFWRRMSSSAAVYAVCALPDTACEVELHDMRRDYSLDSLHHLLSARVHLELHRALYPVAAASDFVGLSLPVLHEAGVPVPVSVASSEEDAWLLYMSAVSLEGWELAAADPAACAWCALSAIMRCRRRLLGCGRALANGNLCLPLPTELRDLTFRECTFIAGGFTVERLRSLPGPFAPGDRQRALLGNVVSFPQNAASVVRELPRHASEAGELLTVFFPSEHAMPAHYRLKQYVVRRRHVLAALLWLRRHNPSYADIIEINEEALASLPMEGFPCIRQVCLLAPSSVLPMLSRCWGDASGRCRSRRRR